MRAIVTSCRLALLVAILLSGAARPAHADILLTANLTIGQEPTFNSLTNELTGQPRPQSFGFATFILNDAMTQLTMDVTVFNIDVTGTQSAYTSDNLLAAHIHAGTTATPTWPVVWGFFGSPFNNTSPNDQVNTPFAVGVGGRFQGTWDLTEGNNTTLAAQLQNILGGRSYINFHTSENPGGEIRGALQVVPEPSSLALMAGGTLAGWLRTRRRTRTPRR